MPTPPVIVDLARAGAFEPSSFIHQPWLQPHLKSIGSKVEEGLNRPTRHPIVGGGDRNPPIITSQRPLRWDGDILVELKVAVDKLAVQQDKLIDLIDKQHRTWVEHVNEFLQNGNAGLIGARKCSVQAAMATFSSRDSSGTADNATRAGSKNSNPPVVCNGAEAKGKSKADHWNKSKMSHYWSTHRNDTIGDASADFGEAPPPTGLELRCRKIVLATHFELIASGIIFINLIVMAVQLQWQSCETALMLRYSEDNCGWPSVHGWFDAAEYVFNFWYAVELSLRAIAFRWHFFHDRINVVDLVVVCLAFFQHLSESVAELGIAPLRFLRVLRALRVMRIMRVLLANGEMSILLRTLAVSFVSLHWSMILVGSIVLTAGLLVMQLLNNFLQDPAQDDELRRGLYVSFGTPTRAVYSMFVATFSSAWVPMAKDMVEHVSPYFGCFWIIYITAVNFAVVRVVSALFLKQTMDVASRDRERKAMEYQKEKKRFARVLHDLFLRYDTSGDGKISRDEFQGMINSKHVWKVFETLDLDFEEVCALFEVMSSDDGFADYEEFLTGALKMKASARTFDAIQIMHELGTLTRHVSRVAQVLGVADDESQDDDSDFAAIPARNESTMPMIAGLVT